MIGDGDGMVNEVRMVCVWMVVDGGGCRDGQNAIFDLLLLLPPNLCHVEVTGQF